ncbi:tRNA (uracil(54)-C(5))-methyltransferase homolog isoform X2 [Dromiciops gliroides]|uniref:tRNA (uracil(54)-C(5))-methyltransferase homolog isoform X2 n=1 Tax=Dromiciops gliroides TaxID=33562 RepID=UPI001CC4D224|nr:tRNA (uracil(54)-C(5))-methyltransferase homolog isoform X2 [Dromiciops gliroides]
MASPRSILPSGALFAQRRLLLCLARDSQRHPQASLSSAGQGILTRAACERSRGAQSGRDLDAWQERLADQLLPLWRLNYDEQLKVKFEVTKKTLEQLQNRLLKLGAAVVEAQGLGALLQPFIPSPVINGYRNKSVFSINRGPDGHPRTVGCFLRSPGGKKLFCVPAGHLRNLPAKHHRVAQCYEAFLLQPPLDPSLDTRELGPWRRLRVRTNSRGQAMAIITFHARGLSEKERAKEFFTSGQGSECDLTSLYLKERVAPGPGLPGFHRYQLLAGEPHIFEDVLGLKLRISPGAFFPLNTGATEALLGVVAELGMVDQSTTILDLSHGTGAMGLCLAQWAAQVLSVRMLGQAVEDARWSAASNEITNWEGQRQDVEKVMARLKKVQGSSGALVALLDPAGAALPHRVIRAIRGCPAIQKLVFVSGRPHGQDMESFLQLCCPVPPGQEVPPGQDLPGQPFVLSQAVPVDTLPHTLSSQLVLAFTR